MDRQERRTDVLRTGFFYKEELENVDNETHNQGNAFKSIEYYLILHFTNSELYYLSDEETTHLNESADIIEDTNQGRIYCFN